MMNRGKAKEIAKIGKKSTINKRFAFSLFVCKNYD